MGYAIHLLLHCYVAPACSLPGAHFAFDSPSCEIGAGSLKAKVRACSGVDAGLTAALAALSAIWVIALFIYLCYHYRSALHEMLQKVKDRDRYASEPKVPDEAESFPA